MTFFDPTQIPGAKDCQVWGRLESFTPISENKKEAAIFLAIMNRRNKLDEPSFSMKPTSLIEDAEEILEFLTAE